MKLIKFFVFTVAMYALSGCGEDNIENRLNQLADIQDIMAQPLMIGASVTASSTIPSPGMILAQKYATDQSAVVIARNGAKSTEIIPRISDEILNARSIVIGIDLMFWDSTSNNIAPSIAALESLIERCAAQNIPLVMGDIPNLLGFLQVQRTALNKSIRELCVFEKNCKILPLDTINQELTRQGFLAFNDNRYTRKDILPDGLHLSRIGSEIVATRLEQTIEGERVAFDRFMAR